VTIRLSGRAVRVRLGALAGMPDARYPDPFRRRLTVPRDPKITPITRHEPRTFYATRVTRTQAGESWDLWSVEDGRRIGFLSVVDDGHVVYALSTVKRGTSHEEVADLVEGFFTPSSTDAHNREIIISDYDEEPEMLESDIRQS
jgi:hypothetical protein